MYPTPLNAGLMSPTIYFGADPEAFVKKDGEIVGSERLIPEEGLVVGVGQGKVIRDGVQVEFNIAPAINIDAVSGNLEQVIMKLREKVGQEPNFEVCFDQVVKISQAELNALSEKSRQFGCAPTFNLYGLPGPSADPATYLFRSGGGHIHLGLSRPIFDERSGIKVSDAPDAPMVYEIDERPRLVGLLDIFVGNTGVLMDRHPLSAERRTNYGKAGEYRLPKYGLEYRVLSNFWLHHPALFGLVIGLSRLATSVLHTSLSSERNYEQEILNQVDLDEVKEAIQGNDLVLAHKNWAKVSAFIRKNVKEYESQFGLTPSMLDRFEFFLKKIEEYGMDYWFPSPPTAAWANPNKKTWTQFLYQECGVQS